MNSLSAGVDQPLLSQARTARRQEPDAAEFYLLAVMFLYAPLFQAGNKPLPLLGLELMALGLAGLLVWRPGFPVILSKPLLAAVGILLLWPLFQLLPLPESIWSALPGRAFYAQALGQIDGGPPFTGLRAGSMVPFATESAWLAILPPVLVFLTAMSLPPKRLQALTILFLGIAVAQAVLGLIQYGDGPESVFRLGNPYYTDSAVGTYVNRNHLAGLLEMALPVSLVLLGATVGADRRYRSRRHKGHRQSQRQRLAALGQMSINRAMFYGAGALVILLSLVFTRSRTGIALGMLGILLATVVFSWRLSERNERNLYGVVGAFTALGLGAALLISLVPELMRFTTQDIALGLVGILLVTAVFSWRLGGADVYGLAGTFTVLGLGLASLIGLAPVLMRFTNQDPVDDVRWSFFAATWRAIREFFPVGSGGGAFVDVFHRFDDGASLGRLVDHAHNDYLEWGLEYGLPATLIMIVLLGVYIRQWRQVWVRGRGGAFRFAQTGAGIALLLIMLHTILDFNLHIPANAVFFAFLAGVFCHPPQQEDSDRQRKKRLAGGNKDAESRPSVTWPQEIPPENRVSPFLTFETLADGVGIQTDSNRRQMLVNDAKGIIKGDN